MKAEQITGVSEETRSPVENESVSDEEREKNEDETFQDTAPPPRLRLLGKRPRRHLG